jgi:hypothetical protein
LEQGVFEEHLPPSMIKDSRQYNLATKLWLNKQADFLTMIPVLQEDHQLLPTNRETSVFVDDVLDSMTTVVLVLIQALRLRLLLLPRHLQQWHLLLDHFQLYGVPSELLQVGRHLPQEERGLAVLVEVFKLFCNHGKSIVRIKQWHKLL